MAAAKRPRASSSSSSSLATNPELSQTNADREPPPHKATRIIYPSEPKSHTSPQATTTTTTTTAENTRQRSHSILCNLPPTCQSRPTRIPNTIELERHYAKFHAHVCAFNNCGCVFPEERFLELHQTECHDPIAALRKERNERIFECHIPAPGCGRKFSTPKTRRLHLIQAHNYPKQYFFAVTNKGIGGLLKKWGEGASLIRKEWKPREDASRDHQMRMDEEGDKDDDEDNNVITINVDTKAITDEDEEDDDDEPADLDATPRIHARKVLSPTTSQTSSLRGSDGHKIKYNSGARGNLQQSATSNADIAGLTQSLNALSLVPNSVRFGRGGKPRGFASGSRGRIEGKANPGPGNAQPLAPMEVDIGQDGYVGHGNPPGRGRGLRGRGMRMRGRGF